MAATGPVPSVDLQLRSRPELRALPGVLHALHLLPLTHQDLTDRVAVALTENPTLERAPGHPCPRCGRHSTGRSCCAGPRTGEEPATDPFGTLAADAGCEVRSDCRPALAVVLAHLTPRGLLDEEPDAIALLHGIPAEAVAEAVRAVKAVGPPGVAETTVAALLAAQARRLVDAGEAPELVVEIVRQHLAAVADDDPASVPGATPAAVREAFAVIRTRLRPSAVAPGGDDGPPRRPADVEIRRADAGWQVEVPDSRWFGLRLADRPERLDQQAKDWLAPHEKAAADLISQLDARASVLRRVAEAAVHRQAGYFDRGPTAHVGLTRAEIADDLGLHPSTVSRAVAGKTLRHPDGRILPLGALFGGAVAIKFHLVELSAAARMTDEQLRDALAHRGFAVARRTVAKYRAELGIPARGRS